MRLQWLFFKPLGALNTFTVSIAKPNIDAARRLGSAIETVKVSALKSYNNGIIKQTPSQANEKETLPANT